MGKTDNFITKIRSSRSGVAVYYSRWAKNGELNALEDSVTLLEGLNFQRSAVITLKTRAVTIRFTSKSDFPVINYLMRVRVSMTHGTTKIKFNQEDR